MDATERNCKQCGQPINLSVGRKDRLFCNEICKNRYHNEQIYEEQQEVKRIQLILKKNRRILKKMFTRKDRDLIAKERLLKEGYEFDYHTHFVISKTKQYPYTFCFDYGYRKVNEELFKVVKAFSYTED